MNVPFLDLKIQYQALRDEINPAIQSVIDNASFVLGKSVSDFETEFARDHSVKHCICVSSGTAANHLVLWAAGIGHGDEVIVPANTFVATAWGATLCGARPVFVDCEPDSYNIDPAAIEKAITPRTKAIVAVDLYGQPADMDALQSAANRNKILLVEDAAQAHLAEYKGRRVGGLTRAASFSFYPGKNLGAYGEGGAVTTNDDAFAHRVKMHREHGGLEKYSHEVLGHNYRMEGIQGAVLGVKRRHLQEWTEKRRAVAREYGRLLAGVGDLVLPAEMPYAKHVYHLYVIQTHRRDALKEHLAARGIGTGLHYPIPLHLQKCFHDLGYRKGNFPASERLAERGLSLPMFAELTRTQIEYVADGIKSFFAAG